MKYTFFQLVFFGFQFTIKVRMNKGVSYVVNEKGEKISVVFSVNYLKPSHIEDLIDVLVSESRVNEPVVALEDV
ncbi:hypothetical protein K9L63_03130 [Candidatus Gracilibacteria bacterium]|nr:hypothetical protein [Candidatus Gracilibacteria bacterium]